MLVIYLPDVHESIAGIIAGRIREKYNKPTFIPVSYTHLDVYKRQAEGYAKSTGKVGVCLVTSGPGATNTVTGLADAHYDNVPLVCFRS